nr:MAG TPA: hypothetical protein [Caudoviricetes sp.]
MGGGTIIYFGFTSFLCKSLDYYTIQIFIHLKL